ncbi:hypothetical protein EDB86DRAFT_2836893 [Lactarius hatsudake]|nr:hypothetical protein EDB86DRAFT_2836893 [Lactarius hatsudake]
MQVWRNAAARQIACDLLRNVQTIHLRATLATEAAKAEEAVYSSSVVKMAYFTTLYNGLRLATLFGALGSTLKELGFVLAPDVDVRTRGRPIGALANTGAGLEGTSDEVSLQALHKLAVADSAGASHAPHAATLLTEAAKAEEGPSHLALWIRPPLGSALRCVVVPSGARRGSGHIHYNLILKRRARVSIQAASF